ncbi:MAG TPA: hypothetical protein VJ992_10460 [Gemmatimonadales bacterium]|jgi:hypothetical protein|nr:hypothetical protein [Gemmatimonadales bacterium]
MAWRVISRDGEEWHVQPAAERRANQSLWQLTLAFRVANQATEPRVFWASYPIESTSKSSLFMQAEKISDEALRDVLIQHRP